MREPAVPASTYRLQLHAGFGFDRAAEAVDYLARLGVSHLYLSPILQAAPESMHGYDVVDHSRVSDALGGRAGLDALADAAHRHGLGMVCDIVPNHMCLPTPCHLNHQLWETLRLGREAPAAHWFDVDWDLCGGRIGLPALGAPLAEVAAAGELVLDRLDELDHQPVLRYGRQVFPLAPGTKDGSVDGSQDGSRDGNDVLRVLSQQHYVLASWREKAAVLGYRRFFDVDTLIAIRVELPDVFEASHRLLLDLYDEGVLDGFRIDHPDGLADPEGYLEQLRDATDGAWVVAEKILECDERLPATWPTAGTTGYDAIKAVSQGLVPDVSDRLNRTWASLGGSADLHGVEVEAKRQVLRDLLSPELGRLARAAESALGKLGDDGAVPAAGPAQVSDALAELLVQGDVYRAYLRPGHPTSGEARRRLDSMHARARQARPDLTTVLALLARLVGADGAGLDAATADLVTRFQQTCGPVMAKGVEDTTFYRWHRFIALNEVGGDPSLLDRPSAEAFHDWARHQQRHHPHGMTTLSTHDTKRSEDVRARLFAIAEDAGGWEDVWRVVAAEAGRLNVDLPTAYLLMQTILGACPITERRLVDYLRKAVREAKQHTGWTEVDEAYERRVFDLAQSCLSDETIASRVARAVAAVAQSTRTTTLAAKLLQLAAPGVPDTYQGTELVDLSLVDPDNRRAVDYDERRRRLQRLDAGDPAAGLDDEKLLITSRALRLRRDRPELFGASCDYQPLAAAPENVLGFLRGGRLLVAVTRWPGRLPTSGWAGAAIDVPPGSWDDTLSGKRHAGPRIACARLFSDLPVALLVRQEAP